MDLRNDPDSVPSEEWDEEMLALEAIYGDNLCRIGQRRLQIILDDGRTTLDLRLAANGAYPLTPPLVAVQLGFLHFCPPSPRLLSACNAQMMKMVSLQILQVMQG